MLLKPLRMAALAASLYAAAGPVAAIAQTDLLLDYDVRYGGVAIMKLEARLRLDQGPDGRYAVAVQGRTVGLIDRLKPIAFTATSEGAASAQGLRPGRYATTTRKRNKRKGLTIAFAPDRAPVTQFTPPDDAEEPAPPELLEGSLDPATALLAAVRSVAETASCAGPLPVFDGKRRYDVSFTNLPRQILQKTGSSGFSGEASVCRLKVKPLHGFKPGKRNALDGTTIWFGMAVGQAPPVPVRIETEISLGAVSIELGSARWANQQASR